MKTLLTAWDAEVIAVGDPEAAVAAIEACGGSVTGLLLIITSTAAMASPRSGKSAAASARIFRQS